MASGGKLSDRVAFVDYLKEFEPEIIGGEMEAAGVAAACDRARKDWIIVKGICDWGYDKSTPNKDANQRLAASNIYEVLQRLNLTV